MAFAPSDLVFMRASDTDAAGRPIDAEVVTHEFMSMGTVGWRDFTWSASSLSCLASPSVLGLRHDFQMCGIDASAIAAQMVDHEPTRDVADVDQVGQSMGSGVVVPRVDHHLHCAVAVTVHGAYPFDA